MEHGSKADDLPDDAHVVRYVKPRKLLGDGSVDGSEFRLRPDDKGLSVNWLECFRDRSKEEQLAEVRRLSRLQMRASGCLAELNVGATKRHVQHEVAALRFVMSRCLPMPGAKLTPRTVRSWGCLRETPRRRRWLAT